MWIAQLIQPGTIVYTGGIHDENIVRLPMPDGIPVIPRVGRALFRRADIVRKCSPVGPDFPPGLLKLRQQQHTIGQRRQGHSDQLSSRNAPDFYKHVARKSYWIAGP